MSGSNSTGESPENYAERLMKVVERLYEKPGCAILRIHRVSGKNGDLSSWSRVLDAGNGSQNQSG